jgi:hypothetical protein
MTMDLPHSLDFLCLPFVPPRSGASFSSCVQSYLGNWVEFETTDNILGVKLLDYQEVSRDAQCMLCLTATCTQWSLIASDFSDVVEDVELTGNQTFAQSNQGEAKEHQILRPCRWWLGHLAPFFSTVINSMMFLPPLQDEDLFLPVGWAGRDHSNIEILDICSRKWHKEMKDNFCLTGIVYLQFTNLSLLLGMGDSLCFSSPNQLSSTSLLCMSLSFFGSPSFFDMHVGRFYYVLWWLIAQWFMIESNEHNARRGKGRDLMYAPGGAMLCGLYLQGTKF